MAPSENTRLRRTTTDGTQLALPPQSHSASPLPKSMGVTYYGWRHASKDFMSWAHKLSKAHQHTWRKAGIFEAIMASTKKIHKDPSLMIAGAEKWCPRTNSFVFPWGEATITLEDVMVLLGFSVLGLPHFASLQSAEDKRTKKKLEKVCLQIKKEKTFNANQVTWVSRFMDSGDELEHVAFLALWLSYFVFPTRYYFIDEAVLPLAVHLSSGRRIALAPAVLSHLYAELSLLRNHIRAVRESTIPLKIDLCALFKLVQVWTWERFRELQPPNPMLKGDHRLALWHDLGRKKRKTKKARKAINATQVLENSTLESFEWRPYTTTVENWNFPQFYPEKAMWVPVNSTNTDDEFISYARCIRVSELVGIDCVEHYFPNRVASQFGMVQEITCSVKKNHLSQVEAWRNYDKPIDDLVLYIPSRSTTTQASPRIRKSLQLQRSSMSVTSNDGVEESMNKKRAREDGESSMVYVQTQVQSDNDDGGEADRLTNAQWLKRRFNEKYNSVRRNRGDASKRSRLEADDTNDSGSCHNLVSKSNDTVPLQEIEQRNEDGVVTGHNAGKTLVLSLSDGNNFSSPLADILVSPPETMQTCDDELDIHGSTADDNAMINDGSMEADCLLQEQYGVIAGDDGDKMGTSESGSQAVEINVLITSAENNFSSSGCFDGAVGIAVSPQESMQTCDDELNVHGSNADGNNMIDDSSKAPVCLLNEDGVIAGDETEQRVEENNDDVSEAGELSIPIPSDENNSSDPPLASEGASEDKGSSAHKSMGLSSSDNSTYVGYQAQGHDCLPHDDGLGSEETVKSKEQLEDLGKSNEEGGVGNDSVKQRSLSIQEMAKDIEERIMKAQKRVAWLKARKAMKQRNVTSARFG